MIDIDIAFFRSSESGILVFQFTYDYFDGNTV